MEDHGGRPRATAGNRRLCYHFTYPVAVARVLERDQDRSWALRLGATVRSRPSGLSPWARNTGAHFSLFFGQTTTRPLACSTEPRAHVLLQGPCRSEEHTSELQSQFHLA